VRVLYFTRDYTPHDHRFLTALAGSGNEIYSLRLERRGRQLEDRPLPPGVTQIPWRGGQCPARWQDGPALVADFKRVVRQVKPDVVHAGSIQTAALVAALSGFRPLVSMSWGSDLLKDADRSSLWRWATRFTLRRSSVLVGDCQAVQRKAESLGFPADRVVLFPWGIDLQQFTPGDASEFRERQGWQDAFVLLSLRSWESIYGVDVLVKAFARAAQAAPQLRLMLLGGGSQATALRQILIQNDLLDRVYYGGQVGQAHLPEIYRAADLYISASHSDGSSVSLMEALGCGRPVLVSDIPGNCEWITPGEQGWLFPDGDVAALADAMLNALRSQERLAGMGRAARRLAEQRADWNQNFQKLLSAYHLAFKP
jgi:glycosyltransferase involved in cell wall biosynthesis